MSNRLELLKNLYHKSNSLTLSEDGFMLMQELNSEFNNERIELDIDEQIKTKQQYDNILSLLEENPDHPEVISWVVRLQDYDERQLGLL